MTINPTTGCQEGARACCCDARAPAETLGRLAVPWTDGVVHTTVAVCPHAVFAMVDKRAVLADRGACMECGACARNCAEEAIRVRSGVGCAAGLLTSVLGRTDPTHAECGCSGESSGCC